MDSSTNTLTAKDFDSGLDIRWCPGCGDAAILKQVQSILPQLNIPRENFAFISGIGCSSRFPYYTQTYGMHSIHGRATAIASGLKMSRPELSVWIVTGDGDGLSIGGNHMLHLLRRNLDLQILLFNNRIYGLTKGQFSPTTALQQQTKSSPYGTTDHPLRPASFALGAGATFFARSFDKEARHLQEMLRRAAAHKGSSLLEIMQNCHIYNDGAFDSLTDRKSRKENLIFLEQGKPLIFGENGEKGIRLDGCRPQIVSLTDFSANDLMIHDESDRIKALILSEMDENQGFPAFAGVFLCQSEKQCFVPDSGPAVLASEAEIQNLLLGRQNWEIQ